MKRLADYLKTILLSERFMQQYLEGRELPEIDKESGIYWSLKFLQEREMKKHYVRVKKEIMDLFGNISVEEIVRNKPITDLIEDISKSLEEVSLVKAR